MTPDYWERRALPCVAGYNYCGSGGPLFSLAYDSGDDKLILTSDTPVFVDVTAISFETSDELTGTFMFGQISVESTTEIWILSAAAQVEAPTDVIQVDVSSAGPTLIGTWTGSVHVEIVDTSTYPLLTGIYSPATNQVAFTGERFTSATAGSITEAIIRLESYAAGCLDGGALRTNIAGGDLNGWTVVTLTDELLVLENSLFTSCDPDDEQPWFTVVGVAFDAPNYGTPVGDGYYFYEPWGDPSPYSAVIDGTTPPPPPSFDAEYMSNGDVLAITAADPIFVDADAVDLHTTSGLVALSSAEVIFNPDEIHIAVQALAIRVDAPNVITQIDVYDTTPELIASRSGDIDVPVADLEVSYNDVSDELTITSSFPALAVVQEAGVTTSTGGLAVMAAASTDDSTVIMSGFAAALDGIGTVLPTNLTDLYFTNGTEDMKPEWSGLIVIPAL